jgi:hypothetical protein
VLSQTILNRCSGPLTARPDREDNTTYDDDDDDDDGCSGPRRYRSCHPKKRKLVSSLGNSNRPSRISLRGYPFHVQVMELALMNAGD